MPTLPLYDPTVTAPGGWRNVSAPGGWQQWRLDVVDDATRAITVITLHDGRLSDSAYQRRYLRFMRSPTRRDPPQPSEYRAVEIDSYSFDGESEHRLITVDAADFEAKRGELRVRVGDYSLQPEDAASFKLAGPEVELTLQPGGSDGTLWSASGGVLGRNATGRCILHVDFGDAPKPAGTDIRILFDDRAIVRSVAGRTAEERIDAEAFHLQRQRRLSNERWQYSVLNDAGAIAICDQST